MSAEAAVAERWVLPFSSGSRDLVHLLGGKGANLAELARLGVPVPPGFVITTEACRAFLADARLPHALMGQVRETMADVEAQLGRRFGDPENPLLVSVRSGAPVSMPGMMDTILNVGLGPATIDGFARAVDDPAVAHDCMRRLTAMFQDAVSGALPDDPPAQLEQAIAAVFESWNSKRAKLYRRYHKIADSGTAVVIQAMVFGNAGPTSGTGVLFTRDPSTGEPEPFGDYLAQAQGEDIVAGSHNTDDLEGMRHVVPEAHAELLRIAALVEGHFHDLCEIEFTVEHGRLWLLQSRAGQRSARAAVRVAVQLAREGAIGHDEAIARVSVDELDALLHPRLDRDRVGDDAALTTAIGASPGLATGRVVLDGDEAVELAACGEAVVLVRSETRPDDLEGILASTGLLTTRGGKTSHAAVVTRGLGRPCVCGAEEIEIDAGKRLLRIGDAIVRAGEVVSIDGDSGLVLRGAAPVLTSSAPEEVEELLTWCDEARTLRVAALATVPGRVRLAAGSGADEIVLALAAGVEDPAALVPAALAAAGALPVTVLSTTDDGDDLESVLRAVAEARGDARTTVIVPARAWERASASAAAISPALDVAASAAVGESVAPAVPLAALTWDEQASTLPGSLPAGVSLALPPDLRPPSLALARAVGARALIVPPDRVAVARLALAKESR